MAGLTCGGPRIVPFQLDMSRSSPSSKPYEHASAIGVSDVSQKKNWTGMYQLLNPSRLSQAPPVGGSFLELSP